MSLDELKKFSVSRNFFLQVVKPLHESGKVKNPAGLLDLLKKVHSSLWQPSGYPEGFSGALAGTIQEILDGYKYAVKLGYKVQFGAEGPKGNKIGGDTVIYEGDRVTRTTQFKATASGIDEIEKHITKAAWQLTGAGGETPAKGSIRCVEVIVQDTENFASWPAPKWAESVKHALDQGYDSQKPSKSKDELYAATDFVIICTKTTRFAFKIGGGDVGECTISAIVKEHGYVFGKSGFANHWQWLTNDWWSVNKAKYDIKATREHGVGSKKPKTPDKLPFQETA